MILVTMRRKMDGLNSKHEHVQACSWSILAHTSANATAMNIHYLYMIEGLNILFFSMFV